MIELKAVGPPSSSSTHMHNSIHLELDPLALEFREEMHVDPLRSNPPYSHYGFKGDFFILWVFLYFPNFLQLPCITIVISKHKPHNESIYSKCRTKPCTHHCDGHFRAGSMSFHPGLSGPTGGLLS